VVSDAESKGDEKEKGLEEKKQHRLEYVGSCMLKEGDCALVPQALRGAPGKIRFETGPERT